MKTIGKVVLLSTMIGLLWPATLLAGNGRIRKSANAVKNEYIVVLEDDIERKDVARLARELTEKNGKRLHRSWSNALKGFVATMTEERAAALALDPRVRYVEENALVFLSAALTVPTKADPAVCNLPDTTNCDFEESDNRLWHLDAIDQDSAVPSHEYRYCQGDGTNTTIYVVDTGVAGQHSEFLRANGTSRVEPGFNASGDAFAANDPCHGFTMPALYSAEESNELQERFNGGHGTAVASVAAGKKVGIAKNATIVPVKVAPCQKLDLRFRHPETTYAAGDLVFYRVDNASRYFQAISSSGTTGSGDAILGSTFRITPVGGTFTDGTVTWQRLANNVYDDVPTGQTTAMLISGLDWIVSAQNPYSKTNAVVTMSTYRVTSREDVMDADTTNRSLEEAARAVSTQITLVASANNQNTDSIYGCPANLSRTSPTPGKVITVGGLMVVNNPDRIDPVEVPLTEQANGTNATGGTTEPNYQDWAPTQYARWVCGAGDSDACSTDNPPPLPTNPNAFGLYTKGSNGGPTVTLFAPARNISVAGTRNAADYRDPRRFFSVASGTSWSAPIVAGVIATMLPAISPQTPDAVHTALLANVVEGALDPATLNPPGVTGTPNKMLRIGDVRITTHPTWPSPNASQLSVVATGTAPLTYQWYQVNASFDLSKSRGAARSTPIANETSSTLAVSPLSTATGYWVRVTGCGVADSNIAVVELAAPTSLTATKNGPNSVAVSWTGSPSATKYELERKSPGGNWTVVATITSSPPVPTSHTDTGAPSNSMLLYRVRAGAGSAWSAFSKADFANTNTPANASLVIKAVDITEQRAALNQLCGLLGIADKYAPADVVPSSLLGISIDDVHFTTLMTKINEARGNSQLSLTNASFVTTPAAGQKILLSQIQDLRSALQ